MSDVNVDMVHDGKAKGDFAAQILANGRLDPGQMRPFVGKDGRTYISTYVGGDIADPKSYHVMTVNSNGTLRRDEWKSLDEAVMAVKRHRLGGIQDLVDRGLVYTLGNAMGTTVLEYHDISDALEADVSMDAVTRAKGDRVEYGTNYLPIPIIHSDYEINARVLATSRNMGNPLDTSMAERAARKVWEKLEGMLFTNTTYKFGNGTIYSYLNFPQRNKQNLTKSWATPATGAEIITDVLAMKDKAIQAKHFGPYVLYIPTAYETVIDRDYDATRGNTIRDRILAISNIEAIKVIDTLPADNVVFAQMTSDVVRLVRGMDIQNVQWQTEGNFVNKYKVMTIQVPQIRADHNGACGVVHGGISVE